MLTRGLYSEGKYRVISLGGDFERSLSGEGPCSGVVSRSSLTVLQLLLQLLTSGIIRHISTPSEVGQVKLSPGK